MGEPVRPTVLTAGVFDLFHHGHVRLLEQAARHGRLIAAVNSDQFTASYKRLPLIGEAERLEVVAACRWVDEAVLNPYPTLKPLLERFRPDFIVQAGYDEQEYLSQIGCDRIYLNRIGCQVIRVPYTNSVSTTVILDRMRQ